MSLFKPPLEIIQSSAFLGLQRSAHGLIHRHGHSEPDTKGKADTVASALSKQLSVKLFHQCNPRMKHLDTILFRFLFGYIWSKAEKQAGKEIHKLLLN